MAIDLFSIRNLGRLGLVAGLTFAAGTASAQTSYGAPPASGVSYAPPAEAGPEAASEGAADEAPPTSRRRSRPARTRSYIEPYLEVAQVVSAELDGGDTLTYTSVTAGVDGRIETRRVTIQASYQYQRNIEWQGQVGDEDIHSGLAAFSAQVVPGALQVEAGAIATRTGGEGRALGVTDRDESVEVYGAYAGPTLSTHAGPVALNASYRLGYVAIDDDLDEPGPPEEFDSAVTHSVSASAGIAPGRLPVGVTVGAGYVRTDGNGEYDDRFEGAYVRGDVVVPVSPSFALTAGVGYENIEASQNDFARDANGAPIIGPDGAPSADPTRPRLLTYDLDGIIYDAGLIWRPSARTEVQIRGGRRYGGTTVVGTVSHRVSDTTGVSAAVFDTVETFSNQLISDLGNLPDNFEINSNSLTGGLGGCTFGAEPGSGVCLSRTLQSIRRGAFRMRGASVIATGGRGLWDWGIGAAYAHRRYGRSQDPSFDLLGPNEDDSVTVYGAISRRLSRTSDLDLDAYATWYDADEAALDRVFGAGTTATYSRSFMLERLRLIAALGLYHTDEGEFDSTIASGELGLRLTF